MKSAIRKWIAIGLLSSVGWLFVARTVMPAANQLTPGFLAYYIGAQALKDGWPGVKLYDEAWFADQVSAVSDNQVRDIFLANPPATAVLWLPLAALPVETARSVWTWLNVAFFGVALWLITYELQIARWTLGWVGLVALFSLSAPTREQFQLGQMYVFLLLLHVIGWRAFVRQQDRLAGITLGLAIAIKLSGWPIGLIMLAYRRWRAVRWAVLAAVAAVVVTLPFVSLDAWREWSFVEVPAMMSRPEAAVTAYQTTTGFWQHLFRYHPTFNPAPLADWPGLATALTLLTAVAALGTLVKRRPSDSVAFVAAVALTELLSPAAEQYHYVLLLLPLAVLWRETLERRSIRLLGATFVATFLIAAPITYEDPSLAAGWTALLAYPRLYGGWLVWGILLFVETHRKHETTLT